MKSPQLLRLAIPTEPTQPAPGMWTWRQLPPLNTYATRPASIHPASVRSPMARVNQARINCLYPAAYSGLSLGRELINTEVSQGRGYFRIAPSPDLSIAIRTVANRTLNRSVSRSVEFTPLTHLGRAGLALSSAPLNSRVVLSVASKSSPSQDREHKAAAWD